MAKTLKPHQQKAVDELQNGNVLCGGVGTGKSLTAAAYYVKNESPRDIFVITTAKKRDSLDWQHEFSNFAIGTSQDATVAGVLTVDSWNNIGNYTSVHGAFFIFDEQRVVGSGAWVKAFQHIAKSNHWIMLSATPGDTWLDYIPVFIANGFYKNRTQFTREHVIYNSYAKFPKVDRYVAVGKLVRYRNQILVDMPYERHTVRIPRDLKVEYDAISLERITVDRWNIFKNRPLRDIAELFSAARKVVGTDPSRLARVQALMKVHPRLIVFYNFDYELELLRSLCVDSSCSNKSTFTETVMSTSEKPSSCSPSVSETDTAQPQALGSDQTLSPGQQERIVTVRDVTPDSTLHQWPEEDDRETLEALSIEARMIKDGTISGSCLTGESGGIEECLSNLGLMSTNMLLEPREMDDSLSHQKSDSKSDKSLKSYLSQSSITSPRSTTTRLSFRDNSSLAKESSTSKMSNGRTPPMGGSTRYSSRNGSILSHLGSSGGSVTSIAAESSGPSRDEKDHTSFVLAEWNGHKHEPIPTTDRWVYLVQYQAGAEGWNCTETDAMVFYSLTYSHKMWDQAHGRIDRLDTLFMNLYYYTLISDSWIDKAIYKSLKAKKNFHESAFAKKIGMKV